MISFKNDYSEGAHPSILERLVASNGQQEEGYGYDSHSTRARALIGDAVGDSKASVHFVAGGTQANYIAIGAFLRPFEACISAATGHIAVNEAGAIEHAGHKVITVPSEDGKITSGQIEAVVAAHPNEHVVKPKLVYISLSTELGTVYTRDELEALYAACQANGLILYIDGARIGNAIAYEPAQLDFKCIYAYSDAFFIGGTKNGALLGEAIVIKSPALSDDFSRHLKQNGALLAKGRVVGIQFETLFESGLYLQLASWANERAQQLAEGLKARGIQCLVASPTNQVFPILSNETVSKLRSEYAFHDWKAIDESHTAVRFVTSWATSEASVCALLEAL